MKAVLIIWAVLGTAIFQAADAVVDHGREVITETRMKHYN